MIPGKVINVHDQVEFHHSLIKEYINIKYLLDILLSRVYSEQVQSKYQMWIKNKPALFETSFIYRCILLAFSDISLIKQQELGSAS